MSFANKTLLAAILFLSIQFMSMVGGVQFIAKMQNYAALEVTADSPHEGMSLDHVVPLDPFLGGTGLGGADSKSFVSHANALCALLFSLLVILTSKNLRHRLEFIRGVTINSHRLWLSKRSLLL